MIEVSKKNKINRKQMDFLIDKYGWCGPYFYKDEDGIKVLKKWLATTTKDVDEAFKFLYNFNFCILD